MDEHRITISDSDPLPYMSLRQAASKQVSMRWSTGYGLSMFGWC